MFNYSPAALQLARIVTSSLSSHLCPFSNHFDPPFTHLGPPPKHFIISLHNPKNLCPCIPQRLQCPSQGDGMSVVIQRASFINLSGEFHTQSQGWSSSFDSPKYRWGVFLCTYPVTRSLELPPKSLELPLKSLLLCAHGNEPLITPHTAKTFSVLYHHVIKHRLTVYKLFSIKTDILHAS